MYAEIIIGRSDYTGPNSAAAFLWLRDPFVGAMALTDGSIKWTVAMPLLFHKVLHCLRYTESFIIAILQIIQSS